MARDSAASEHSVQRVLYIRTHDPEKFEELQAKATNGEDVAIHLEHSKVRAEQEAEEGRSTVSSGAQIGRHYQQLT